MRKKRILITGLGIVSAIGTGKEEFWHNLFAGRSGMRPITIFDTSNIKVKSGCQVHNFDPHKILNEKRLIDMDRATLLLLSATQLCLDNGEFRIDEFNTHSTGVVVGTTFGSLHSVSKYNRESLSEGPRFANPSIFPSTVGNSAASRVSIRFKIKGFCTTIATGMSAGLDALDYARDFISLDKAQTVIVGAVEDLSMQMFLGFYKLKYLSGFRGHSQPLSCPFDKRRDGIVLGEGATVFVLQDEKTALESDAFIYGEILGIGSSFDPARYYKYNPQGEGMKKAMTAALEDASLKPQDIDCIFANANSTTDADEIEARAIKKVFGDHAAHVPVTSVKSMVGETFSNSGSVSLAAALGTLNKGLIPPTINYLQKDDECDLDCVVMNAKEKNVSRVMVNAFGPNGMNTSLIIGRCENV